MLVRDPARRCSLTTVRKHPWMRVEVPQDMLELDNSNPIQNINCTVENEGLDNLGPSGHIEQQLPSKGQQPLNEQVLRVMQSLGIDPTRTTEVSLDGLFQMFLINYFGHNLGDYIFFFTRFLLVCPK